MALLRLTELTVAGLLLIECSTPRIAEPPVRVECRDRVEYRDRVDSIYVHDSVRIAQRQTGDTVFITRDRWHTEYRERILTDTVIRTDSVQVPVPYTVEKTVFKTPGAVKVLAVVGLITFVVLAVLAVIKIRRTFC